MIRGSKPWWKVLSAASPVQPNQDRLDFGALRSAAESNGPWFKVFVPFVAFCKDPTETANPPSPGLRRTSWTRMSFAHVEPSNC